MESKNASLQTTLEESKSKVTQLEEKCVILSNNLIAAGKENDLLKEQVQKAKTELDSLRKQLSMCKFEKDDLTGKLKMALTELDSATSSIKWMNTGSKKLDEILGSQKTDKSKTRLGYSYGASTSKNKKVNLYLFKDTLCTP